MNPPQTQNQDQITIQFNGQIRAGRNNYLDGLTQNPQRKAEFIEFQAISGC
jgi:hypothetical protein